MTQAATTPEAAAVGKWVRRKSDGREFQVMHLGRANRDGRHPLYGRALVAMLDEVEVIDDGCCDGTIWEGPFERVGRRCGKRDCGRCEPMRGVLRA